MARKASRMGHAGDGPSLYYVTRQSEEDAPAVILSEASKASVVEGPPGTRCDKSYRTIQTHPSAARERGAAVRTTQVPVDNPEAAPGSRQALCVGAPYE